jgi:hypothetical protein
LDFVKKAADKLQHLEGAGSAAGGAGGKSKVCLLYFVCVFSFVCI